MSYENVKKILQEIDRKMKATDPRFKRSVKVIDLNEGTVMFFDNAFVELFDDEWYCVITEHHGSQVFYVEDVRVYQYEKRISIKDMKI